MENIVYFVKLAVAFRPKGVLFSLCRVCCRGNIIALHSENLGDNSQRHTWRGLKRSPYNTLILHVC